MLLMLQMFRESLKLQCKEGVCGVCAMYKPTHTLKIIHMQDIPNIHLLKASDESLTTITWKGQSYSLQGVAFKKRNLVHICDTCITQLKKKKVRLFLHKLCAFIRV